jgi:NAD(P)-dependent dehydrogenase (short-subunit alcohol dehydrogenase family)
VGHNIDHVPYDLATPEEGDETVRLVEAHDRQGLAVQANVQSQDELDAAIAAGLEHLGHIDFVVINHGVLSLGTFWELTEDSWSTLIDINLSGVWRTAKAVAPHLIERRSGSIVVASSVNAIKPSANYSHYCAAKAGILQLVRAMALELGPYGIRCNTCCRAP